MECYLCKTLFFCKKDLPLWEGSSVLCGSSGLSKFCSKILTLDVTKIKTVLGCCLRRPLLLPYPTYFLLNSPGNLHRNNSESYGGIYSSLNSGRSHQTTLTSPVQVRVRTCSDQLLPCCQPRQMGLDTTTTSNRIPSYWEQCFGNYLNPQASCNKIIEG